MAQQSYPNSSHASGAVTAIEYEKLITPSDLTGLVGVPTDPKPVFADGTARAVKVRSGTQVKVRGQLVEATSDETLTIAANATGSTRLDLVVAGLNRTTGVASFYAVTGTASLPSPITTDPSNTTGKYEFPLAKVTVPNGAPTLADAQVTTLGWYLGEPIYLCRSDTRPPHRFGRKIRESDTGNEYTSNGTAWLSEVTDSGWVNVPAVSTWSSSCQVRKINGVGYLAGYFTRTAASLGPNVTYQIGTVPPGYRPDRQHRVAMGRSYGGNGSGWLNPDGAVVLAEYDFAIVSPQNLYIATLSYPIGG